MLVLLGALKRKDLSSALREQTRAKMESAFGWRSGHYEWGPWIDPPGEADLVVTGGISVLEHHLRTLLDALPYGELETLLEPSLGKVVTPTDMDVLSTSLRLSPRELRFIELQLDGTRSIHDAVTGSPLGRLGSLRLVAVGLALGVLQLEGTAGVDVTPAPSDDLRTRRKTAADELRSRLERRLREVKAASHFDVLGVHWSSHHREYRKAWETARKEFDLQSPPLSEAPDEVKKLARDILREIDLAKETLEQKDKRIAYRKDLFDKTERQYAAEMLLKQGEVALLRGDRAAALESLETAAELYPTAKVLELLNTARDRR
jgi:tetratricopeptide (TPR) repeat protein